MRSSRVSRRPGFKMFALVIAVVLIVGIIPIQAKPASDGGISGWVDAASRAQIWVDAQMIPMDFSGDGKTDILVFRPSDGAFAKWYSGGSIGATFNFQQIGYIGGQAGAWANAQMIPVDFNGDGKTDILVFRPSDGAFAKWYSGGSIGATFNYQQIGYIGGLSCCCFKCVTITLF